MENNRTLESYAASLFFSPHPSQEIEEKLLLITIVSYSHCEIALATKCQLAKVSLNI